VTDLNNLFLELAENRFRERVETMPFQIIEERDTKLLLVVSLDETEVRLQSSLLVRLQIIEEVTLYRWSPFEG